MKSIKKLGLAVLLAGSLVVDLNLPNTSYAEHKGRITANIREEGYSIYLDDKRAMFLYRNRARNASLAFTIKDEVTGDTISYIMEKYDLSPSSPIGYLRPDVVKISTNNFRETRPTEEAAEMWKKYLEALHQKETQLKWLKKYILGR